MGQQADRAGDPALLACRAEITDALLAGESVQRLIDRFRAHIGNPIIASDISSFVIAHSDDREDEFPLWNEFIDTGCSPVDLLESVVNDSAYTRIFESDVPVIFEKTVDGVDYRCLCMQMTAEGKPIGFLSVFECERPISAGDSSLLEFFARTLSFKLGETENRLHLLNLMEERYLVDILENPGIELDDIRHRMAVYGIPLRGRYVVVCLKPLQGECGPSYLQLVKSKAGGVFPDDKSVVFDDAVVLVLSGERRASVLAALSGKLVPFLEANELAAGSSPVFSRPEEMRLRYQQARKALALGALSPEANRLARYERLVSDHVWEMLSEARDLVSLCDPVVLEMLEYDRRCGTSFARTLWLFLENRCQMKPAAEALGIHRNTLDYRLNAIERTFDVDVYDRPTASSILWTASILRYLHERGIIETPELAS